MGGKDNFLRYEELINLHILVLTSSLFNLIQWRTSLRVVLRSFEISSGLSSANRVKLNKFDHLRKLLISMRNGMQWIKNSSLRNTIFDKTVSWAIVIYGYILFTLRQVGTEPVQRTTVQSIHTRLLKENVVIYRVKSFCKILGYWYNGVTTVNIIVNTLQCVNDCVRSRNIFLKTELICTEEFQNGESSWAADYRLIFFQNFCWE